MNQLTLIPPQNAAATSTTVNGRAYSCAQGSSITVPDFDGMEMLANGWRQVVRDPSAVTLAIDPAGNAAITRPDGKPFSLRNTPAFIPTAMNSSGRAVMASPPTVTEIGRAHV